MSEADGGPDRQADGAPTEAVAETTPSHPDAVLERARRARQRRLDTTMTMAKTVLVVATVAIALSAVGGVRDTSMPLVVVVGVGWLALLTNSIRDRSN